MFGIHCSLNYFCYFVNFIICLVAAVHLIFATYYDSFELRIPANITHKGQSVGGKFIFLTYWNECIETLFFIYAVFENVVSRCTDNENRPLRKIRDYWFLSIVFPLSAFVSVTFWVLWAVNRELVMPKAVDPYFPSWLNHSVHTFILIYSFLELLTTYHKATEPAIKICYGLWFVTVTYLLWCIFVWYQCNLWVYPVLEVLNWPGKIAFFASCLLMATLFAYIGYNINKFVWGNRIQKNSMQLTT